MFDKHAGTETMFAKLRWLMASRVVIVTFMLGMATFIEMTGGRPYGQTSMSSLFLIIVSFYVFVIAYLIIIRSVGSIRVNLYVQACGDLSLITGLVYGTGGINSIYSVFYPLVIIYSAIYLGRRGGVIIASTCCIFYGLLSNLEYYGIIAPSSPFLVDDYYSRGGYVFSRLFIHVISFYVVALLASFVVEREKQTRSLLEEKETAFQQLDLLHRSIIESVNAGILTVNLQGRIKSFNAAAAEITGYRFEEVENKNVYELLPSLQDLAARTNSPATNLPERMRAELPFLDKQGRPMTIGCSISPLKSSRGTRIGDIIIFQDLTMLKAMEEDVERNKRLAFVGEMAAVLAHEMRNPLASMSGSIQVLRKDLELRESDERLMQIILRGKDQLEQLLRDFLVLAKPVRGKREWFDVRDVITDVAESMRYVGDWHDDIEITMSTGDATTLFANPREVRQVLWNLTLNAVQSMRDGGAIAITVMPVEAESADGALRITIADTGCGIDPQHLDKITEPFYTTKEKGTGLGLAIARRILERYDGRLHIGSILGTGTTCTIVLPRHAADNGQACRYRDVDVRSGREGTVGEGSRHGEDSRRGR